MDVQRDAIESLHKRIRCLEYEKRLTATTLHTIYYSILSGIQVWYIGFIFKIYIFMMIEIIRGLVLSIKKCTCRIRVVFSKIVTI